MDGEAESAMRSDWAQRLGKRLQARRDDAQRWISAFPPWAPRASAIALVALTAALLLRALLTPTAAPAASATPGPAAPQVNHYAPDVTLVDASGNHVRLASLRGKVVVLNFWYASCPGCQIELPTLEHVYQQDRSAGLVIVGVDVADDARTMTTFTQRIGLTYPVFLDESGHAMAAYQLSATPSSFVIDRQGVIRDRFVGPVDPDALRRDTSALLSRT
jgi:peroxiredoxin